MSYKQKKIGLIVVTTLMILIFYCFVIVTKLKDNSLYLEDINVWIGIIISFIAIENVMIIITQIIFHFILARYLAKRNNIQISDITDYVEILASHIAEGEDVENNTFKQDND